MPTPFTALVRAIRNDNGAFAVNIPEDWMQGRTTYGGLTAALSLEATLRAFPDLPPLRSAQVSFIGPAGGDVVISASMLRRGKSVTFAGADLAGASGLAARSVFAFGAARASAFGRAYMPAPKLPSPEDCGPFMPDGPWPAFAQHYDTRLARGARPVSGSSEHDHFVWVRHKDKEASSIAALIALADVPPPAVMPMMKTPAPLSSMTWIANLLTEAPRTRDGWWLLELRADNAGEGYSSQDMLAWNRDGEPVIAGRQSVAVFA
jgi:acyl-CoA thioesterase